MTSGAARLTGGARRLLTGDAGIVAGTALALALIRLASSLILTRLLAADAFAVMGVITAFLVTLELVSDTGIIAYVIRDRRSGDPDFLDELWTLRLIRAIALALAGVLLAPTLAWYLGQPGLTPLIAVAAGAFVIDGLSSLAAGTALRERRLRAISAVDIAVQLATFALSVGFALALRSVWALVLATLGGQAFRALLSYRVFAPAGRRWRFRRARVADLWQFSRFVTASTFLTMVLTQADKLILARLVPLSTLGLYVIAGALAAMPTALAGSYASRVLYPAYAAIVREAPARLACEFYALRRAAGLPYALACGLLIGIAPAVIAILYDPRYLAAGPYLQIVAIATPFALATLATNELFIALGQVDFTLRSNLVRLTVFATGGTLAVLHREPMPLVWAVGLMEPVAACYGWRELARNGLFDWRREAEWLLAAGIGVLLGAAGTATAAGLGLIR